MLGMDFGVCGGNSDSLRKGTRGSAPPQMTKLKGAMREPKEGVTMSHASQAPFHGVGGYIYIYIYIYIEISIYIYIYMYTHIWGPIS